MYQFKVNYNRVGLSRLSTADQVRTQILRFVATEPLHPVLFTTSLQSLDLCDPAAPRQVREVHWASLPLLRLCLQHDGRSLRLLLGLPPLQGGGCG